MIIVFNSYVQKMEFDRNLETYPFEISAQFYDFNFNQERVFSIYVPPCGKTNIAERIT